MKGERYIDREVEGAFVCVMLLCVMWYLMCSECMCSHLIYVLLLDARDAVRDNIIFHTHTLDIFWIKFPLDLAKRGVGQGLGF